MNADAQSHIVDVIILKLKEIGHLHQNKGGK